MATITIPKNLIKEKDMVLIPRLQYESLLKYSTINEKYESLLKKAVKNKFFKSYSKSDEIYDQV